MHLAFARSLVATLSVLGVPALAGCGGGGGGGDSTKSVELALTPQTYPTRDSEGGTGGFVNDVQCGDREDLDVDPNTGMPFLHSFGLRGFVGFDLGALPPDAEIVSATLTLVPDGVYGDPYGLLGDLLVDSVVYGAALDPGAYSRSGPADAVAVLSSDEDPVPKSCDVTTAVVNDLLSSRAYTQYRLRFPVETNLNADSDFVVFFGEGTATTPDELPRLVVVYR